MALLRRAFSIWIVCVAGTSMAQGNRPLDLSLPKVAEGIVVSVREVHAGNPGAAPAPPQSVGAPAGVEQAPPVGAVMYIPLGPESDKGWRVGAAGTPDMQARFAQTAYEVVVDMEDGERRTFRPREPRRFQPGQRVRVRTGELEPAGP